MIGNWSIWNEALHHSGMIKEILLVGLGLKIADLPKRTEYALIILIKFETALSELSVEYIQEIWEKVITSFVRILYRPT